MTDIPPIRLGSILFSLVEPHPGQAVAFNRWYERDHFYAGCMMGPNFLAGRRWVATRRLKGLRFPETNPVTSPERGSLLVLYWILAGQHRETVAWAVRQVRQLHAQGRMNPARDNVSTAFYQFHWSLHREGGGIPVELALDHPFQGLAVLMLELGEDTAAEDFERQCREQVLPAWLPESPVALLACLRPEPLPEAAPANVPRADLEAEQRRYLWLGFMPRDPEPGWVPCMKDLDASLATTGARLIWAAPFIPTVPGTDTYMDQL